MTNLGKKTVLGRFQFFVNKMEKLRFSRMDRILESCKDSQFFSNFQIVLQPSRHRKNQNSVPIYSNPRMILRGIKYS